MVLFPTAVVVSAATTLFGFVVLAFLAAFNVVPDTITGLWLGASVASLPLASVGLWRWVPPASRTRALVHAAAAMPISTLILIGLFPTYPDGAPPERLAIFCLLPVCLASGRALWSGARSRWGVSPSALLASLSLAPLATPWLTRGASECVPVRVLDVRASRYTDPVGNHSMVVGFTGTEEEAASAASCLGASRCLYLCRAHTPLGAASWRSWERSTVLWEQGDEFGACGVTAEYFADGWVQLQEWCRR